mmetsp:Transcript_31027/g.77705  ORF Transcript_31027/g.77705 Transcript_31027/m.77705 type:complete len:260 (+) Transcript_31027:3839-4618(+)
MAPASGSVAPLRSAYRRRADSRTSSPAHTPSVPRATRKRRVTSALTHDVDGLPLFDRCEYLVGSPPSMDESSPKYSLATVDDPAAPAMEATGAGESGEAAAAAAQATGSAAASRASTANCSRSPSAAMCWISDAASARTWAEPGASNSWSAHDAAPRTADRSSQSNAVIGEVGAGLLESSTPCSRPPLCCSAVHDVSIETSEPTARSTARRRLLDAASRHVRAAWAAAASDATEDSSTSTPKVVRSAATEAATVAAAAE